MRKSLKIVLIIIIIVIAILAIDTIQAKVFNNSPIIKLRNNNDGGTLDYIDKGILVDTYVYTNGNKETVFKWKDFNYLTSASRWTVKETIYFNEEQTNLSIGIVPTWENRSISEKFNYVEKFENTYNTRNTKIESNLIGENLGTAVLTGYDIYTDTEHKINSTIYGIKNYPEKCVIAVQFENDNDYYVYINSYYSPETLKEFIEDLNLREIVEFGSVWYDYSYIDEKEKYHYENVEFIDVEDEIIWQMLFDNLSLENVHNDNEYHDQIMSISVNIPLFGYENISVWVSEDGYLSTNILDTGKTFYIGQEKVKRFVNYILENYQGYTTKYIYPENNENITQNDSGTEITVVENTLDGTKIENTYIYNKTEGKNYTEPYDPLENQ